ncbi:MAG: hypothetical protein GXZ13_05455 [Synergistaceae bacterium]|jgi:hypothetical protein|nr:hypothetical protein [Synergistaceae bacterium]
MKKLFSTFLIIAILFVSAPLASAIDLGSILKDAAITIVGGTAVKALAPQLDEFINTITFNKGVKFDGFTKVVPILSIGSGTRIGAAQVGANTKDALDRTKAVAQLEGEFQKIRAQALIPIDKEIPISQFKRVKGVGVTAIIDVKL